MTALDVNEGSDTVSFVEDIDEFRSRFADWIAANADVLAPFRAWADYASFENKNNHFRGLQALLWDAGWTRHGWPASVGGLGGTPRHRACAYDTLYEHDILMPEPFQILEVTGSVVSQFAPELGRRLLPSNIRGDELWSLGLSEPDSGSDLASLRTRARRDGDCYVLTGQKIWNSFAQLARYSLVLCRTGDPELRHNGLSILVVDLESPGIERRIIRAQTGRNELAEVFFDEVRVSREFLIGDEGDGWRMLMWAMQFERGTYTWPRQTWLHKRLETLAGMAEGADDVTAFAVGEAALRLAALRLHCARTLQTLADGEAVGFEASVDKLLLSGAEEAVVGALKRVTGSDLALGGSTFDQWRFMYLYSQAVSIFGGADEVQLDIVSERLLGLPRGGARRG